MWGFSGSNLARLYSERDKLEKILVVDDNRQIADFLAHKVLPNLGFKGPVAYSGSRALKLIQERHQQLSLVILDWQLPDMTGLDVLQQMKNQNLELPTIIITGEGSEEVAVEALRLGVQDYLIKPVDAHALGEAIDRALEKNRLRNQNTMLTSRLKHQLSWMSEISKIGLHITSSLDLNEVLKRVITSATEMVCANQGSIALLEPPGERLYLRAVRPSMNSVVQYLRVPISIPQFSRVLARRKPVMEEGQKEARLRNLIHIPLIVRDMAIGVMSISRLGEMDFSGEEESKLLALSDYAAIAINNAIAHGKAQNGILANTHVDEMQRAITQGEFALHYQPIVSFDRQEMIGFEALIRWIHPERGILIPGEFIPFAEDNGMISDIDRWVLKKACQQLCMWQQGSVADPLISISVNVNAEHITNGDFVDYVSAVLSEYKLDPSNLKLEIPEKAILQQTDKSVDLIKELASLGIRVLVDDFGRGYSSLGHLAHLPLEALKIDRSFTKGIHGDIQQQETLNAIVALTNRLNVNVVAEGIETPSQLEYLKGLGCSYGQGYLFAKPMETSAVPHWLQTSVANASLVS